MGRYVLYTCTHILKGNLHQFYLNVYYYSKDIYNITCFSVTGGATYCAIASLRLMGYVEDNVLSSCNLSSLIDLPLLLDWILQVCTSISFNIS